MFSKSIVLLLEHNVAWGSRGVIVNKALAAPFRREHPHLRADAEGTLLGSFSSASPCVLLGGPVEPSVVTVLHREAGGGGQAVAPGLFMATTEQEEAEGSSEVARLLRRLREGGGSSNGASGACRTFVGYAGWSAGQLQEEVKRGDWCVSCSLLSGWWGVRIVCEMIAASLNFGFLNQTAQACFRRRPRGSGGAVVRSHPRRRPPALLLLR